MLPVGVLTFGTHQNKDGVGFMGWFQRLSEGLRRRAPSCAVPDRLLGRAVDPALLDEFERPHHLRPGSRCGRTGDQPPERDPAGHRCLASHSCSRDIASDLARNFNPGVGSHVRAVDRQWTETVCRARGRSQWAGKTTSIAKLAQRLVQSKRVPMLVAADTFRAAAIDQFKYGPIGSVSR